MSAGRHLPLMQLPVMYRRVIPPVPRPVLRARRWQLLMSLHMQLQLPSTLQPLSGMRPTLLMLIVPRPENVSGNTSIYSD
jgi:hypothetical protein